MTSVYLPDDCIYYILKYLRSYRSTLFNCLLVNRFWCKATIPLLYANPFVITNKNNCLITLTLILCIDKSEILQLNDQLKLGIDIDIKYKPLFEYPKYIENYNYSMIDPILHGWFNGKSCVQLQLISANIIPIIHQLILQQCSDNIKQLDIELELFYHKNYNIRFIKTFTSNLTKLYSLTLITNSLNEIGLEFLNNIGDICLNLRELTIYDVLTLPNTIKEKLYTMIQKQNNLKLFKISSQYHAYILNDILISLESQKNSLNYIEFEHISFDKISLKNFINFCNLKYLKFDNCSVNFVNKFEILKFASFKLKELNLQRTIWDDDLTSLMIKYLGESLQQLVIEDITPPIIESILTYCPILTTLSIRIKSHVDLSVIPYFKNLKIRTLNIILVSIEGTYVNLAKNMPISVKEISIHSINFNFIAPSYFKKFLEGCHNYLEIINLGNSIHFDSLKVILNYTKRINNSLKLGVNLEKRWNDKELELLDEIKNKGVKLVNFDYKETDYNFMV